MWRSVWILVSVTFKHLCWGSALEYTARLAWDLSGTWTFSSLAAPPGWSLTRCPKASRTVTSRDPRVHMRQTLGVRCVQKRTAEAFLCTTCTQDLHEPEDSFGSLGSDVTVDAERACGCWTQIPRKNSQVLGTTEPSGQHPSIMFLDLFLPPQSGCLALPVGRGLLALI